jgi:prophage regulatory protein
MNETIRTAPRLLRLPEVLARVPLKKPTIYRAIRAGKFPAPCKLLGGRASAWDEAEIGAWIASRLAERTGR